MLNHTIVVPISAIFVLLLVNYHVADAQLTTPILDAKDDTAQTNEDSSVLIDVMSNDVYTVIIPSISSVSQPSHGQAVKEGNKIRYTPNANYFGSDSFSYTLSNGIISDSAVVSVNVASVNDSPSAASDVAVTNEDVSVYVSVLSNDSDVDGNPLTITSTTQGSHGQSTIVGNEIRYTPNSDFNGQDSFGYTISDGNGGTASSTVSVTINPVNDAPVATNDSVTINEDSSVTIAVLSNDSDVDGDSLVISSVGIPSQGVATINPDKTITYSPNPDFNGQDSFTYTINDGNGGSASATVYITVMPVTDLSIIKTQSGLVYSDPLNNETKTRAELEANQTFWHYGGSAFSLFNPPAPTDLYKDSEGLHLGVQTPTEGVYAGYYAVTPQTDAKLFHAKITTPVRTIADQFFQNGLYVQTSNGLINYVTCVSITSKWGTSWHVIRTYGDVNQATQFEVLWSDYSQDQPLTRDCSIITNGDNYLKVYLDGAQIYNNSTMNLQMPGPFLYFLEPQNPHAEMLYGIYNDYYSAKDETITVTDVPANASHVEVVGESGTVFASAPVSGGTAILNVGMYHFPLAADIKVFDSTNAELVATSAQIYGGDQYAIDQR